MYESKQASKLASTPLRAQGVIPNLTVCETRKKKKKKAFYIRTYRKNTCRAAILLFLSFFLANDSSLRVSLCFLIFLPFSPTTVCLLLCCRRGITIMQAKIKQQHKVMAKDVRRSRNAHCSLSKKLSTLLLFCFGEIMVINKKNESTNEASASSLSSFFFWCVSLTHRLFDRLAC